MKTRTLNKVVALWDLREELVELLVAPVARNRKARDGNVVRVEVEVIVLVIFPARAIQS